VNKKSRRYPLVYIVWLDHWSETDTNWADIAGMDDDPQPQEVHSVGWVVSENAKCVRLVPNFGGDPSGLGDDAPDGYGATTIVKAVIKSRRRL